MRLLVRTVIAASFLYASQSVAQDNIDPSLFEVCRSLFVDGSRNVSSFSSDTERARSYFRGICSIDASSHDEFKRKARDLNTSADTAYGFFKLKYNDKDDFSASNSQFKLACDRTKDESYLRDIVSQYSSEINGALADSFNECIKDISIYAKGQSLDIFQTYELQGPGGLDFSIYINYAIDRGNDVLKITSISPSFVECTYGGKKLSTGQVLPSERAVQDFPIDCRRPENEEITFTIAAEGASSNKVTIARWNDPIPELRSRADALASELSSTKQEMSSIIDAVNAQLRRLNTESPNDYLFHNPSPTSNGGGNSPNVSPGRCPVGQYVVGVQPFRHRTGQTDIIFQCAKLPELLVQQ